MTVAAIVKHRLSAVLSTSEDENLLAVAHKLSQHRIGALVVLNRSGGLAGIISEADLVRALSRYGLMVGSVAVRDVMTREVHSCSPRDTEIDVMSVMAEKQIRHMPVLDGERVVGLVSLSDAVRHRLIKIRELTQEVEEEGDAERRLGLFTRHLKRRIGSSPA